MKSPYEIWINKMKFLKKNKLSENSTVGIYRYYEFRTMLEPSMLVTSKTLCYDNVGN